MYREVILDHYRKPRHAGEVVNADATVEGNNPMCGDELVLTLRFDSDVVADAAVTGSGCSISQASASMMTDAIIGKSTEEVSDLVHRFKAMMTIDEGGPRPRHGAARRRSRRHRGPPGREEVPGTHQVCRPGMDRPRGSLGGALAPYTWLASRQSWHTPSGRGRTARCCRLVGAESWRRSTAAKYQPRAESDACSKLETSRCSPTEVGELPSAARLRGPRSRSARTRPPSTPPCGRGHFPRYRGGREWPIVRSPTEVGELPSAARLRGLRSEAIDAAPFDPALRAGPLPPLPRGKRMANCPLPHGSGGAAERSEAEAPILRSPTEVGELPSAARLRGPCPKASDAAPVLRPLPQPRRDRINDLVAHRPVVLQLHPVGVFDVGTLRIQELDGRPRDSARPPQLTCSEVRP